MRRKFLIVIALSTTVNAALVATLGFTWPNDECDVSARGLVVWSDDRAQLGLPRERRVTVEPAPEDAELPPCAVGSERKTHPGEFRPV